MLRSLLAPVCRLVGHDWAPPFPVRVIRDPMFTIYRTRCHRCGKQITGDWDWMEVNRAWKHYRRSL